MNYTLESDFEYKGYRCVVIFSKGGHRCGYVGITNKHPLYGKYHSDQCLELNMKNIENDEIGKRGIIPILCMDYENIENGVRPDCYFDVHGGITYSDDSDTYPVKSDNLWWLGFDCAHCDDGKDLDLALKYGLIDNKYYESMKEIENKYPTYGTIRSLSYCEQECKNLVDQLETITK